LSLPICRCGRITTACPDGCGIQMCGGAYSFNCTARPSDAFNAAMRRKTQAAHATIKREEEGNMTLFGALTGGERE